ncbi:methyltransferase domain-containing protein [Termitidicoccus mucosus]|uniref:SAM-dependent methyltransferase n=1 Tax=Termitidicoccus mucosus TaxID=1184151 RepID=A0A178IKF8_9BACT|nr:SAM-dependent methyltransferase [Opitutaceae bacterium TSB47]
MPAITNAPSAAQPGSASRSLENLPGHWVLARMGKRVLRPGGMGLTRRLLAALDIGPADDVVEFAPGLGATARLALAKKPASYTAVERDGAAAETVRRLLAGGVQRCIVGNAEATGLPAARASVVYGEAMLTMHAPAQKAAIAREAFRVLRPGGRYGIHEIALTPDTVDEATKRDILQSLSHSIRVGARPQTLAEWKALFENAGFRVKTIHTAPLHLLEPRRLIQDEGFFRALKFVFNVMRTPEARRRVRGMRGVFRKYAGHLSAVMMVLEKPAG